MKGGWGKRPPLKKGQWCSSEVWKEPILFCGRGSRVLQISPSDFGKKHEVPHTIACDYSNESYQAVPSGPAVWTCEQWWSKEPFANQPTHEYSIFFESCVHSVQLQGGNFWICWRNQFYGITTSTTNNNNWLYLHDHKCIQGFKSFIN